MKKKVLNYIIALMVLVIPFSVRAATLTTYGETVTKANNYITSYTDRRKYLIFNKNYVYEKSGFGDSSDFKNGGLLSKSEFDLSIVLNQSYLATGKEYWTLTSNSSNKYYIDVYAQTKNPSSTSGTRVTEYIKPATVVNGKGTYANPWTFTEGYAVDVISNNTAYGKVTPSGAQYVVPGSTIRYEIVPSDGYYYNARKDECGFVKEGANKYENNYLIQNINRDITCTVVFDAQTYKFNLQINNESKDYKNAIKVYTSNPSPNPIYYKHKKNWYSNSNTTATINKITVPTITGWTFNGYYYGSVKVIDSSGNILVKDLNLGSANDFRDIEHTLYANITKNNYSINYNLNGGSYGTKHPTSAKYDEVVEISNPTKAGYKFEGWSFNGNSSTAKTGSTLSNVNTIFTASGAKTLNQYFANLTPTKNGIVTLTANWSSCPAGTFNDGTKTTCTICPTGSYNLGTGNTSCKAYNVAKDCSNNNVTNTVPSNAKGLYRIMAEQAYLDNAKSTYVTSCSGVNFDAASSDTNGKGVYEIASTKDDAYPIYYYRGAVTNNNVKFAGFCWKAVRTTETGGVKLIYNGSPDASGRCTNKTGTSTQIKTSVFNNDWNSPAGVGYMYGTKNGSSTGTPYTYSRKAITASDAGIKLGRGVTYSGGTYTLTNTMEITASNYNQPASFKNNHYTCFSTSNKCTTVYYVYGMRESLDYYYYYISISGINPNGRELIDVVKTSMFRNDRDSVAKTEIDKWYRNNMTSYTSKIEDTVYCNDRSISKHGGWSPTGSMDDLLYFSGNTRIIWTRTPSLVCERTNDKFTVSSSIGNGKLTYPVGLLSADEVMYAGGHHNYSDVSNYLYTNQHYWIGTPENFGGNFFAIENIVAIVGTIGSKYINEANGLRPVISLSKNTNVSGGNGTANNPYVIG